MTPSSSHPASSHQASHHQKDHAMHHPADSFGLIQDIDVRLTVELGRTHMSLRDVLSLTENSIVTLDTLVDEPLNITVNGKLIARGEVVAEGNRFGLRILEMVGQNAPSRSAPVPSPAFGGPLGGAAAGEGLA